MGAPDPENTLFLGFSVPHALRPWSRKGPDHGVRVDPENVIRPMKQLVGRQRPLPKTFVIFH